MDRKCLRYDSLCTDLRGELARAEGAAPVAEARLMEMTQVAAEDVPRDLEVVMEKKIACCV